MPAPALVRMTIRGLWPDHNPLRRASDRAEAVLVGVLLVMFLALAPITAVLGASWAARAGAQALAAQHGGRYQVTATLLADARYQGYGWPGSMVQARWTAPDGARRTGAVNAPVGTRRGATVRIWTDHSGQVLTEPMRASQVASQSALAAVVAPVTLAFLLAAAGMVGHQLLERRRLAAWEADWRATGPQWTRQR